MQQHVGMILNNRYHIVRLLAVGGYGTVYLASDLQLNKSCAVKENLDNSPDAQRNFLSEARLLGQLSHPNLPRVSDYFDIPGTGQFLVMDFIEGDDLETMRGMAGGALSEAQVMPWIQQVCDALIYLHGQNPSVIHRDIKPANIRITPEGKAVLVDFGIAKQSASSKTTVGAKAVTPGYSPPEQYTGTGTDERSDVYALGATLYTLLTGIELSESIYRLMAEGAAGTQPPHLIRAGIHPHVSQAIMHAVQPDRARRFASIDEFQRALFPHPRRMQSARQPGLQLTGYPLLIAAAVILLVVAGAFLRGINFSFSPGSPTPLSRSLPMATVKGDKTAVVEFTSEPSATAFVPTSTFTPTFLPSLTPTTEPTANNNPRIFDFSACQSPCDGKNAVSTFPERTTKIHLNWKFENIPPGAEYTRIWRVDGMEWVRYVCNWDGPMSGEAVNLPNFNPLYDYEGLRSGLWELVMIVNGEELLKEQLIIEGNWLLWTPAGVIHRCTGLK